MDKFFNLMYDFFSFALPGACIIMSILLIQTNNEVFAFKFQGILTSHTWQAFLVLAVLGYIVGYVINPIMRWLLLIKLSIYLFGNFVPKIKYYLCIKDEKSEIRFKLAKKSHERLAKDLKKRNQSEKFIRIRELAPRSAQYIEFWDMHITMSHNLAFACIFFMLIQINNCFCNTTPIFGTSFMIILLITAIVSFLSLLSISLKFSFWWRDDINAALKWSINNKDSINNLHKYK